MSIPANSPIGNISALADCDRWLGAPAAFVGRYLGDGGHVATPLAVAEAQWILAQGRGIILVFNNATATSVAAGWPQGKVEAEQAIRLAQALGVPTGTAIWLDCEYGWAIHPDYIKAWCETILQAGYVPGIYGCLASQLFANAFAAADAGDKGNVDRCLLWDAKWQQATSAATAPAWGADPRAKVWQYADNLGPADEDEVNGTLADIGAWCPPEPPPVPVVASTTPPPPITPAPPVPTASVAPTSDREALAQIQQIVAARLSQN